MLAPVRAKCSSPAPAGLAKWIYNAEAPNPSNYESVNFQRTADQIHFKVRTCDRLRPPSNGLHTVKSLTIHTFIIRWDLGLSIIIHFAKLYTIFHAGPAGLSLGANFCNKLAENRPKLKYYSLVSLMSATKFTYCHLRSHFALYFFGLDQALATKWLQNRFTGLILAEF